MHRYAETGDFISDLFLYISKSHAGYKGEQPSCVSVPGTPGEMFQERKDPEEFRRHIGSSVTFGRLKRDD